MNRESAKDAKFFYFFPQITPEKYKKHDFTPVKQKKKRIGLRDVIDYVE
jgi:hypothetical protein